MAERRVCFSIAGSDPSGGAGLQADLKTFAALGVYGAAAVTALTAQNTTGVQGVVIVEPAFVRLQIQSVLTDLPVAAAKTSMLGTAEMVRAVAEVLRASVKAGLPLVVDPVMVARSGDPLLEPDAEAAVREQLLPLATVATPNRFELARLTGLPAPTDEDGLRRGARALYESLGGRPVLAKGGAALPGALDLLIDASGREHRLTTEGGPYETQSTHGTGCTLSAALTAYLALGEDLVTASIRAKAYVAGAIRGAPGLGAGHGPLDHGWASAGG